MWFDEIDQIKEIAQKNGTTIFVVPDDVPVKIPRALILQPETKTVITIEQAREIMSRLGLKQIKDQFVLIRSADKLGLDAANALLKNLEEPGEKVHYVLITDKPSKLLPTILSRGAIYFWRNPEGFNLEIKAEEKQKILAKKLLAAKPKELVEIAEKIAKSKTARADALEILGLVVEMLYKSYFINRKEIFVKKIPKFLTAYENINKNGHVKLHLVADLC